MNLSPEQKQKVIEMVAKLIADEIGNQLQGGFMSLVILPLAVVEKMTGISRPTIRANLPIVEMSGGKHGVTVAALQAYIEKHTRQPK